MGPGMTRSLWGACLKSDMMAREEDVLMWAMERGPITRRCTVRASESERVGAAMVAVGVVRKGYSKGGGDPDGQAGVLLSSATPAEAARVDLATSAASTARLQTDVHPPAASKCIPVHAVDRLCARPVKEGCDFERRAEWRWRLPSFRFPAAFWQMQQPSTAAPSQSCRPDIPARIPRRQCPAPTRLRPWERGVTG